MFVYNYRIFDKFDRDVISLALLTDDNPRFRPNEYHRSRWGFEMLCRYPLVKIIDYREHWAELEASSNPFAIVVMAYLKTLETEGNVQERYKWKKRFLLELYQRGLKRETILAIYKFVDWIMQLPNELEKKIVNEVKVTQEATAMPYITTAERIGIEKSMPTIHQAIAMVLEIKFGEAGQQLSERAVRLRDLEALQKLMQGLKHAQSLSDAEKILDEMEFPIEKASELVS
jgi:hypothetical protein